MKSFHFLFFCLFCLLSSVFLINCGDKVPAVDQQKMQLALKDTLYNLPVNPEVGAERLQALLQEYPDLAGWEKRKKCLREGLLTALELNPPPPKTTIKPLYSTHRSFEHYTIDNVAFECVPGVWVIGNLYKPVGERTNCPALLHPHGHGQREPLDACPRFSEKTQYLSAALATMGVVVFQYDMFGFGESAYHAGTEAHRTSLAQSVQTWSSLRAVDFLLTLKEVDPARIGISGRSGGGTQTFLAAALDERISISAPVVQVSCFFPGGCTCESGRPIHSQCGTLSNNAEIAALAAPRPQLLVSEGKDWTRTVPTVEYPYLQTIYGYYGKTGLVENAHFADEAHAATYNKRCAVLRFFASHWGLDLQLVANADGEIDETSFTSLPAEQLAVFPDKQLPEGALHTMEEIYVALCVKR
ncbi:MAG: acetylxylan esterase [Tannerella sp.]|jgi:dienelactone hydrolase|nr:acetylxylan esterase [Tannerella sp.]